MSIILTAALVGTLAAVDGASVELYSDRGVCVGDARRAEFVSKAGNVSGCWKIVATSVALVFLDGDYAMVPISQVQQPKGS